MNFKIKPINLLQGVTCEEIRITSISVDQPEILGKDGSASCRVQLIAKERPDIRPKQRVTMVGEDYKNWAGDDKYFFDKIASYIGAEIIWDEDEEEEEIESTEESESEEEIETPEESEEEEEEN